MAEEAESKVKTVMDPVVLHGWGNRSVGGGVMTKFNVKCFSLFLHQEKRVGSFCWFGEADVILTTER